MADDKSELTKEQKQKIVSWLDKKGKNHVCPVCLENNWNVADHLLLGMVFSSGGISIGGASYPAVLLVCNNCAYARQFMSVPILGSEGEEGAGNV